MNRALEETFSSLLPRLNYDLPPQLIELASSLLAQSRQKASTLSQQEEIARTYVCCHIACARLQSSHNLPKIEPRPPLPKAKYTKLYNYLDGLLEAKRPQRGPKREAALEQLPARAAPKRRAVNPPTTSASDKALPNRPTPSKERSLAQFRTTTKRKTELSHGGKEDDLPAWIQPMIRALCAALEAKGAAPHVLAGVTSVLTLPSPRPDGPNPRKGMLPGLVIAVFIMTRTRLLGVQTSGKEYVGLRRHFMDTLIELRDDKEVKAKVAAIQKGKKAWEGWEKFGGRDVDGWLLELSSKGWTELDWFNNMQNGVGMDLPEVAEPEDDDANADIGDDGGQDFGGPLRGIGSMLNDRVDYLSARKKEDYAVWAASVMKRVQAIYIAQGNKDAPLQHFT